MLMKMRVVAKDGEYLGDVIAVSIFKSEVLYAKFDKHGNMIGKTLTSRFPKEVDLQVSINDGKWDKAQAPWTVDDEAKWMFEVSQNA